MEKTYTLKIKGTHCQSCEVLIERKFKKIEGVKEVKVDYASGIAKITAKQDIDQSKFEEAIKVHGYSIVDEKQDQEENGQTSYNRYFQIIFTFFAILAVYLIVKKLDLIPTDIGISENMSLGFIFIIGLIAASSTCLAVTGGLLLAIATKHNERHPNLSGLQKFKPHIYFNIGRIISYTLLGGIVGLAGSFLSFSARANALLTITASILMIFIGFQLLDILPFLRKIIPKMPKSITNLVHDKMNTEHKAAPFLFGAATFFFPCGFTQALQFYVLAKGDFMTGAITMLIFSLGTLPALLGIGALTSYAKGNFKKHLMVAAAIIIILLGIVSIRSGITLYNTAQTEDYKLLDDEQQKDIENIANIPPQVIEMKVQGYEYYPAVFTIKKGVPVEWKIDSTKAVGCAQIITIPKLKITEPLAKGVKTIKFTPTQTGELPFSCTMGMTTPGAKFIVIE